MTRTHLSEILNPDTDWFSKSKYGLFVHFLPMNQQDFQESIEAFDTEGFATDCQMAGASYVFFTLGQISGYYNVPNAAYNKYTGYKAGEKCSERDLAGEIYEALERRGIKLMLYVPGVAPTYDEQAGLGLGCVEKCDSTYEPTGDWITTELFTQRWSEVLKEYSDRYGTKVHGWWVDGCYSWAGFTNETARLFSAALKSGNPQAIVAFNPGAEVMLRVSDYEDYAAGEYDSLLNPRCFRRSIDGIQWHQLSHITEKWGSGPLVVTEYQLAKHINGINRNGGVVTLEVPLNITNVGDRIRKDALEVLQKVKSLVND